MRFATPPLRFLPWRGQSIAYVVYGDGPLLVCPAWWVGHLEEQWKDELFREFFWRLGSFSKVVLYDRPGSGLSRNAEPPTNLDDDVAIFDGLIETLGATQLSLLGRAAAGQWRSGGRACIQTESLGCSFKSSTVRKIAPSLTAQGSGWPDRSRAPNSPRCRAAIIHSGSSQKSQTCSRLGLRQCEAPRRQVARCAASIHLERALYIDGAAIGLTAKQYALLKYLVDRQGNIVSRESLVQKVWHQETTGSNVVDAVVRSLRKKLGPWAPSIETAIGHGYRFIGWRRLG